MQEDENVNKDDHVTPVVEEDSEIEYEDGVDEDGGSGLDVTQKVKKLKEEIKKLKEEKQEYLDGWQRERAQFANYKKDEGDRDKRLRRIFEESFVSSLLPALDSFDMATSSEAWALMPSEWRSGMEQVREQLIAVRDRKSTRLTPVTL